MRAALGCFQVSVVELIVGHLRHFTGFRMITADRCHGAAQMRTYSDLDRQPAVRLHRKPWDGICSQFATLGGERLLVLKHDSTGVTPVADGTARLQMDPRRAVLPVRQQFVLPRTLVIVLLLLLLLRLQLLLLLLLRMRRQLLLSLLLCLLLLRQLLLLLALTLTQLLNCRRRLRLPCWSPAPVTGCTQNVAGFRLHTEWHMCRVILASQHLGVVMSTVVCEPGTSGSALSKVRPTA